MQIIILAHGKAQATFDRHLPLWKAHGLPMTVFSPVDDPVDCTSALCLKNGTSSKDGPHAVNRLREVIRFVAFSDHMVSVIFEYDSFFLGKQPTHRYGLHGIIHRNNEPERFMTPRYACAPWMLDQQSAAKMESVSSHYLEVSEEGANDRLISAWAFLAGVPILPHPEPAVAENTIFPPYDLCLGLKKAQWIHGVKDAECLEYILSQWKS